MTAEQSLASVLSAIPGWEQAESQPLLGGLNNRTFRLRAGTQAGVLKIDEGLRDEPLNSRASEANIQTLANEAGVASRVLHVGETTYLVEYVDGDVWTEADLQEPAALEKLALALARVHALPLSGRSFGAAVAAKRYASSLANKDSDIVRRCCHVIDSSPLPHNLCLCHNDLVAANIIATPSLMLLDWEYACDNDPMFDLATVIEHHQLDDTRANLLLKAYAGAAFERWKKRLAGQRKLYLALLWLWLASRNEGDSAEMERVAARLFTNGS